MCPMFSFAKSVISALRDQLSSISCDAHETCMAVPFALEV